MSAAAGPKSTASIRVAIRVRPLLPPNESHHQTPAVSTDGDTIVVLRQADSTEAIYSFDNAFDSEDDASTIFSNIGLVPQFTPFLDDSVQVKHIGVVAYGQVGTGKTQSIVMLAECSAKHLLESVSSLLVSYCQVKDKAIFDLLAAGGNEVRVRDVPQIGFQVDGLVEMEIFTSNQLLEILQARRPAVNMHSCLFIKHPMYRQKQLAFVDLASHSSSLLTFTLVMESLASKANHAKFRDSKLTMVLQPYLMDFSILLACLSPNPAHVLETQQTLSFATKTKLHSIQSNAELLSQIDLMRSNVDRPLSEELKTHRIYNDLRRLSEKYKTTKFNYEKMETRIKQLALSNTELFDMLERRNRDVVLLEEELEMKQEFCRKINDNLQSSQQESQALIVSVKQEAAVKQSLLEHKVKQLEREQLDVIEKSTAAMLQFENKLQELTQRHLTEREARNAELETKERSMAEERQRAQTELRELERTLLAAQRAEIEALVTANVERVAAVQSELAEALSKLEAEQNLNVNCKLEMETLTKEQLSRIAAMEQEHSAALQRSEDEARKALEVKANLAMAKMQEFEQAHAVKLAVMESDYSALQSESNKRIAALETDIRAADQAKLHLTEISERKRKEMEAQHLQATQEFNSKLQEVADHVSSLQAKFQLAENVQAATVEEHAKALAEFATRLQVTRDEHAVEIAALQAAEDSKQKSGEVIFASKLDTLQQAKDAEKTLFEKQIKDRDAQLEKLRVDSTNELACAKTEREALEHEHSNALKKRDADCEAKLQAASNEHQFELEAMQRKLDEALQRIAEETEVKLASKEDEYARQMELLNTSNAEKLAALEKEHAAQLVEIQAQVDAMQRYEELTKEAAAKLAALKTEHSAELERAESQSADALAKLTQEHDKQMQDLTNKLIRAEEEQIKDSDAATARHKAELQEIELQHNNALQNVTAQLKDVESKLIAAQGEYADKLAANEANVNALHIEHAAQLRAAVEHAKRELEDFQKEEQETTRLLLAELQSDVDSQLKQAKLAAEQREHVHAKQVEDLEAQVATFVKREDDGKQQVDSRIKQLEEEHALALQAALAAANETESALTAAHEEQHHIQVALENLKETSQAEIAQLKLDLLEAERAGAEKLSELVQMFQVKLDESNSKLAEESTQAQEAKIATLEEDFERRMEEMEQQTNMELGALEATIKEMQHERNQQEELIAQLREEHKTATNLQVKTLQFRVNDLETRHVEEIRRMSALLDLAKKDLVTSQATAEDTENDTKATWIAKFKHSEIKLFELQRRMEEDRKEAKKEMELLRANADSRERSNSNRQ